jgi:hypothetical protein
MNFRQHAASRQRCYRKLVFIAASASVIALSALAASGAPASASAATAGHATARSAENYCIIEIAKLRPGQATSRVILDECSTRHAPGSTLPAGVSTQSLTKLVTFYQNVDYTGASTSVYGSAGPCDVSGYGFSDLRAENSAVHGISAYRLYNNCNWASYWWGTNFSGAKNGPIQGNNRYVGARWNDHLYSMRVWA